MDDQITSRVPDAAAAVSGIGFAITLSNVDTIMSIIAGFAATIAAGCAAYYHLKKARQLGAKTEDRDR